MGLHADVQCRDGLVTDDQRGVEHEGPGNADSLTLATRELVWLAFCGTLGIDADFLEDLIDPLVAFRLRAAAPDRQRLHHDVTHLATRIERRDRILEDHLHSRSGLAHRVATHPRQFVLFELHRTRRRAGKLHDGSPGGALTAAGFADESQCLTAKNIEADPADRIDLQTGPSDRELDDEVLDSEQRVRRAAEVSGSCTRHQEASPTVTPAAADIESLLIRSLASKYSGLPTGYQHRNTWPGVSADWSGGISFSHFSRA